MGSIASSGGASGSGLVSSEDTGSRSGSRSAEEGKSMG